MKKNEIVEGGLYTAKVNGKLTVVRVKEIRETSTPSGRSGTSYDVENTATGRWTTFRSAVKFLRPATAPAGKKPVNPHAPAPTVEQAPETKGVTEVADLVPGEASELMAPELVAAKSRAAEVQAPLACPECGSEDVVEHVSSASCQDCGTSFALVDARRPAPVVVPASKPAPNVRINDSGRMATPAPANGTPSRIGQALQEAARVDAEGPPHLIVKALAGTGKTTTLIEGVAALRGKQVKIVPSEQQRAIWTAMAESRDARTIGAVCFNKSIATVLQGKLAERGLDKLGCEAMTLHSLGNKAVGKAFGWLKVNEYRVRDIISEILEMPTRDLWKTKPTLIQATEKLVSLAKMNLSHLDGCEGVLSADDPDWTEVLTSLAAHYEVETNGCRAEVFGLVPKVLERCKDVQRDKCVDFDDMPWLPVVLDLPVTKYDLLLVDESQDLNRCQQALSKKAGRRLVYVGDENQAIYGFAGADAESMKRLEKELAATPRGVTVLPLTMTRRCGKAIVAEAQRIVPDFEAHESNCEGQVLEAKYTQQSQNPSGNYWTGGEEGRRKTTAIPRAESYTAMVGDGNLVLCRVNAPLVSECFGFLREGRKATIQGRDIGAGLVKLIEKLKAATVPELVQKLSAWLDAETEKENAKKNPSETRLISLADKHDCLVCFTEGAESVDAVVRKINDIFTDDRNGAGIKLSSVHKAKGTEADRVFLLQPEGATIPHPMARGKWQREQEYNILYVAITRAIHELVYVS